MKLNKKGFMMAEVIVVSAVVLMTLSTLFVSYNKIYSLYKTRLNYNDVSTLYRLAYYRDCFFNETHDLGKKTISIDSILTDNVDRVFLVYNNNEKIIKVDALDSFDNINQTYKDYVRYLSNSVDFSNSEYLLLMEHCDTDNINCKYAYLELDE